MADEQGGRAPEPVAASETTPPNLGFEPPPVMDRGLDGETTEPEPIGAASRLTGRYRIIEPIGAGGMGTVYRAVDEQLDRMVAIKILPPHKLDDPDAVARLKREARALARLAHPGIVQAFDAGEDGGRYFLVMELVEGEDLRQVLKGCHAVPPTLAADFGYQVADALQHAHEAGLVHRDLKPSNLILAGGRRIKVLDLGLARFLQDQVGDPARTVEGMGMGTPDYMAPEQFRDAHSADPRSDIYALGCTLYQLLTGRVPFPGSSLSEKAQAHLKNDPPAVEEQCPEVPAGLALAVARMLAKRPTDRFQSMREVTFALAPYVAGASETVPRLRESMSWRSGQLLIAGRRRWGRAQRWAWLVAALACAALVLLAAAILLHERRRAGPNPPVAARDQAKAKARPPWAGEAERAGSGILTVAADGWGSYRTIRAAIAAARPGQTIRIIDDATYQEALILGDAPRLAGITLEAPRGAILGASREVPRSLVIVGVPNVTVRGLRFRVVARPIETTGSVVLKTFITATGTVGGLALRGLDLKSELSDPTRAIVLEDVLDGPGQPPVVVEDCSIQVGYDGIEVIGHNATSRTGGIALRENRIRALRGVWLKGALTRVQVVGNRITDCMQAGLQVEDWVPGGHGILLANNTVVNCTHGVRVWEQNPIESYGDGAIEFSNNLMHSDSEYPFPRIQKGEPMPTDGLLHLWRFRSNWRDRAGDMPLGPEEHELVASSLNLLNPGRPDYLRPPRGSPLVDRGAGSTDSSLPRYVGAIPPEGIKAWDWNQTWKARAAAVDRPES